MINAKTKFNNHKSNAKRRGIKFELSFEEWCDIWQKSGKWDERGRGANKYCMCRIGDQGSYSVENVFVGQGKQNVRDGNIGKVDSEETKRKKSEAAKGKAHPWSIGNKNVMHRPEAKAKLSASISGSKHYSAKTVQTPQGIWGSAVECARALNIPKPTVEWRCRNQKMGFAYLT